MRNNCELCRRLRIGCNEHRTGKLSPWALYREYKQRWIRQGLVDGSPLQMKRMEGKIFNKFFKIINETAIHGIDSGEDN